MDADSWRAQKKTAEALGRQMPYLDLGRGDPIVLLQGNPTSSFPWRDLDPYLEPIGRAIAEGVIA